MAVYGATVFRLDPVKGFPIAVSDCPNGLVPLDGVTTIGNTDSGADYAHGQYQFTYQWFHNDSRTSIVGGGAKNASDWGNNVKLILPEVFVSGRVSWLVCLSDSPGLPIEQQ